MEELLEDRRMLVAGLMAYEAKSVIQKVPEKDIFAPVFQVIANVILGGEGYGI